MKKCFYYPAMLAIACIATCSCSKEQSSADNQQVSNIQLSISTLDISYGGSTPTRASASDAVSRLAFKVFDPEGNVAYQLSQHKSAEGFGSIGFELAPGEYTFVAIGHKGASGTTDGSDAANIITPAFAQLSTPVAYETFSRTMAVTVEPGKDFQADMTLNRIVTAFVLNTEDNIPDNAKTLRITLNTGAGAAGDNPSFNPADGLATLERQYTRDWDISSLTGQTINELTINAFLTTSSETTMDVLAEVLDADGNAIATHALADVPFKINRQTVASGMFFNATAGGTLQIDTDWEADYSLSY